MRLRSSEEEREKEEEEELGNLTTNEAIVDSRLVVI